MKLTTLVGIILFSVQAFSAKSVDSKSKIASVLVFKDRAVVNRSSKTRVSKGPISLKFSQLPSSIDVSTLKVSLSKSSPADIIGVRAKKEYIGNTHLGANTKFERERKRIERQLETLRSQIEAIRKDSAAVGDIQKRYQRTLWEGILSKSWNPNSVGSFIQFTKRRNRKNVSRWFENFEKYEALEKQLLLINAKLDSQPRNSDKSVYSVFVDLIVKKEGKLQTNLEYLIPGAGWEPVYDLRIFPGQGKATIEQHARVWQETEESWNDVKIRLSNDRGRVRIVPPTLESYTLSFRAAEEVQTQIVQKHKDKTPLIVGGVGSGATQESRVFLIPGKHSLLSSTAKTKFFVGRTDSEYSERLEVVSSQYERAYFRGRLNNRFDWNLASGPMNVFVDLEFVQKTLLADTPIGGEVAVNVGVDRSVAVRRSAKDSSSQVGIIQRQRQMSRIVETTVENNSPDSKKIFVLEQIPVSELDEVEIGWKELSGSRRSIASKKHVGSGWWEFEKNLGPGEKAEVALKIDLKLPTDFDFSW